MELYTTALYGNLEFNSSSLINDANLTHYYRFEGNSNDSKGSNNGSDANITYSAGNGKFGQGAGFNGSSSKIDLANNTIPWGTSTFSIGFWFKVSSGSSFCLFGGQNGGSTGLTIDYGLNGGAGKLAFTKVGVSSLTYTYTTDTNWHFLVCVANLSGMFIYLDTNLVAQNVNSTAVGDPTNGVGIGYRRIVNDGYFNGAIDDFFTFNRTLSQSEIINLYNKSVAYYRLEGNSNDSVGSNNGTDTAITYNSNYGKFGQGALFNGSNSAIDLGAGTSLNITGDLTINAWVYITTSNSTTTNVILSKTQSGTPFEQYALWEKNGTIYGRVRDTGATGYEANKASAGINQWQMVTLYISQSTIRIYVNKSAGSDGTIMNTRTSVSTNSKIGYGYIGGSSASFNGYIDDVAIFNRALTTTELGYLWNMLYTKTLSTSSTALASISNIKKYLKTLSTVATGLASIAKVISSTNIWTKVSKNSSSWTDTNKNSSSWTNTNKTSSSWVDINKH